MKPELKILPRWIALLIITGASGASAQTYYMDLLQSQEPQLTIPQLKYLDLNMQLVETHSKQGSGSTDSQQLYVTPTVGIGWNYFLYHPDLLSYSFLLEPGYSWQQYDNNTGMRNSDTFIVNGNAFATFLKLKPYATTLTYSRMHEDFQYDFFNSATGDTERWGLNTGYREGAVPVMVIFDHNETESTGLNYDSTGEQTSISLQAQNSRANGNLTDFNYQFNEYSSAYSDGVTTFEDSSTSHHFDLNDSEHFTKSTLASSIFYDHIEGNQPPSDSANLSINYSYEHTPHLHSFYDYFFSDYSTDGAEAISHAAHAGVQHQLYDSLTTGAGVNVSESSSDSFGSQLDQYHAGADASVNYSKKLGDWGRLSLSDSANYSVTYQESSGGELFIANESHTVDPTFIFFLDKPRDSTFISLTDSSGAVTYVRGSDYEVIAGTDPWQIRIFTSGPHTITAGTVVKANYTIASNPTGSYSTFTDGAQFRLDFWNGIFGIFARYDFTENNSDSEGFVLEDVRELQAGADFNWHHLRLGVVYTDRESSLYNYQSVSLSEGCILLATAKNSLNMDFHQQWSSFPGKTAGSSSQGLSLYSFTGRYTLRPFSELEWNNEAGYELEYGAGLDQKFFVARTYLSWSVGKLYFHLGYSFENQQYPSQERERHFAYLRMRRNF